MGEEISGELVVACSDSSKVLELVEEALDEIALAVECEVAIPRVFAVGFRRDDWSDRLLGEGIDERVGIEGLVGNHGVGIGGINEVLCTSEIMSLAWREH